MTYLWIILIIVHLIITAVFAVFTYLDILRIPYITLITVLCVPPVGYFAVLAAHIRALHDEDAIRQIGVEKLAVNNEVYKSVFLGNDTTDRQTVPLQEALLINDNKTKRRLILDVLNSDTEKYVDLLSAARDDKDTEVSHYAATAMVEMMKERELGVQRYEQRLAESPDDTELLSEYIDYLGSYIDMGLLDGAMLEMYRYTYIKLIDKYFALDGPKLSLCSAKMDTQLALGDYSSAQETSDFALESLPDEGEGYIMRIKLCNALHDADGIKNAINAAKQRGVYFTLAQRETMEFWSNGEKEKEQG